MLYLDVKDMGIKHISPEYISQGAVFTVVGKLVR